MQNTWELNHLELWLLIERLFITLVCNLYSLCFSTPRIQYFKVWEQGGKGTHHTLIFNSKKKKNVKFLQYNQTLKSQQNLFDFSCKSEDNQQ